MGQYNLDRIFNPNRVAIICQGNKTGIANHPILANLIESGFNGTIYPVQPEIPEQLGIKTIPSVNALEPGIDLVIIAVPLDHISGIISACVEREAGGALIIFDTGTLKSKNDLQLMDTIRQRAYDGGLRLLGPGSLGFIRPAVQLNASLTTDTPKNGELAFISQSSAVSAAVLHMALQESFGFSHFVDIGDMLDIDVGDMIDYLGNDYRTKSILLYMEDLAHVRKFMSAARAVSRIKPICVLKANRFNEQLKKTGPNASVSQPDEDSIYNAAFNRAGIIRVETLEALFDVAELAAKRPRYPGARLAIMSTGHGPGLMALDALKERKGTPAELALATLESLEMMGACEKRVSFPINIGQQTSPVRFKQVLDNLLDDKGSDAVLVIVVAVGNIDPLGYAEKVISAAKSQKKPIIVCLIGGKKVASAMELLNQAGLPTFETPERSVRAFLHMAGYARNLEILRQVPPKLSHLVEVDRDKAGKWITQAPPDGNLTAKASLAVLKAYGFTIEKSGNTEDAGGDNRAVQLNLGAVRDTLFGPIIYLRLGGKYTVSYQKAAVGLLPMNRLLAARLIEEAEMSPIVRGGDPLLTDPAILEYTIIQLSQLMIDFPDISKANINPLEIQNEKIVAKNATISVSSFDAASSGHLVISAYPVEFETITTLKDNFRVFARPVRPEDAHLFREFFNNLSPTSIYYRFFSPMKRLSPTMLARFTQIDYDRDIALVAVNSDQENQDTMYGVARIIGDADSISGEFAVLVGDPWHGKGIGAYLLQKCLDIAKSRGFKKVVGYVLQENRGMLALGKKLGFSVKKNMEEGDYELIIQW